jgi:hypothetical protein
MSIQISNKFDVSLQEYALIVADLNQAREFLSAFQEQAVSGSGKCVRKALTLAAIVAYFRPFKLSLGADGKKRRGWAPEELVNDLPPALQKLHKKLEEQRDQVWAHTDWKSDKPNSYGDDGELLSFLSENPWQPMEKAIIPQFQQLIDEVERRLL